MHISCAHLSTLSQALLAMTCYLYLRNRKNLGEREMLWEYEPQVSVSTVFRVLSSSPKLSRETRGTCFLFLLENTASQKRK